MAAKVCLEPGCPAIGPWKRGRCQTHDRARGRARGTRQANGYDAAHDRERKRIQDLIDAGQVVRCWRCKAHLIGRAWHLDHNDDRSRYRGPACVPCNLHLAGKKRHGIAHDAP